jgi:hypothetical protein
MSDLVNRLKIRGMQPREMPNHYIRRMEVERIEAANEIARLTALKDALAGDKINLVSELRQVKAELAKAVKLIELAVELARWDLNPTLRDQLVTFATEMKGRADE